MCTLREYANQLCTMLARQRHSQSQSRCGALALVQVDDQIFQRHGNRLLTEKLKTSVDF
jgi:hypothetical protein